MQKENPFVALLAALEEEQERSFVKHIQQRIQENG